MCTLPVRPAPFPARRTPLPTRRALGALAGRLLACLAGALAILNGPLAAQTPSGVAPAPRPCDALLDRPNDGGLAPSADLYCLPLSPVPGVEGQAVVELGRPVGPFSVSVTRDGRHRYATQLSLSGVPSAEEVEGVQGYVAWVAGPTLFPEYRLGTVRPGTTRLAEITLDKFLVIVSAEPDTTATERSGRILFRADSPSSRMQPADVIEFALGAMPGALAPGRPAPMAGMEEPMEDHGAMAMPDSSGWILPPMPRGLGMLPRMMDLRPQVRPLMPGDLWREGGGDGMAQRDGAVPVGDGMSGAASTSEAASMPEAASPLPARPHEIVRLDDGDVFDLEATVVERDIDGHRVRMYAYNGQYPGPLL
ncbi:MAG TPA: hypothetical protein VK858_13960, partial [Longimicrobiales bacterium]|nr:hypothetical protein [Longimicrobiales bacterium]